MPPGCYIHKDIVMLVVQVPDLESEKVEVFRK